jgi:1,4-alpha-glucan branching enzyme
VGDFNRWNPEKDLLSGPDGNGYWTRTISLPAGRYEYLFLMNDAMWLPDPAVLSVDDGLGGTNSVIVVEKQQ